VPVIFASIRQYVTVGGSFMNSDVQFLNYTNIWSEGNDTR